MVNFNEAMNWDNLKALLWHTLYCTVALSGYILIAWLAKVGLGDTWLSKIIGATEGVVLVTIFFVFTAHLLCDLYRGIVKNVKSIQPVF